MNEFFPPFFALPPLSEQLQVFFFLIFFLTTAKLANLHYFFLLSYLTNLQSGAKSASRATCLYYNSMPPTLFPLFCLHIIPIFFYSYLQ